MKEIMDLQKKLYPDLLDVMQQRYVILQNIELLEPIGRRALAENTNDTERHIRGELDVLSKQGLVTVTSKGMQLTKEGKIVINQLASFMHEAMGLDTFEKQLEETLQLERVVIVPGNSDEQAWVKQEMGKACVSYLQDNKRSHETIAV
ncbi:sugar-binding domain-containing protein, partial [Lentibacillus halophilus]